MTSTNWAIAMGGDIPVLVTQLQKAEQTHQELLTALRALDDKPKVVRIDWRPTERRARRLMADWRGLLGRHVPEARQALGSLLERLLMFTPIIEGPRRGYQFEGAIATGAFLGGNCVG